MNRVDHLGLADWYLPDPDANNGGGWLPGRRNIVALISVSITGANLCDDGNDGVVSMRISITAMWTGIGGQNGVSVVVDGQSSFFSTGAASGAYQGATEYFANVELHRARCPIGLQSGSGQVRIPDPNRANPAFVVNYAWEYECERDCLGCKVKTSLGTGFSRPYFGQSYGIVNTNPVPAPPPPAPAITR